MELEWIPSGPSAKREITVHSAFLRRVLIYLPRYDTAKKLKESQDAYCAKVTAGQFEDLGEFPEDLAWEPLAEVLRGRVKVLTCGSMHSPIIYLFQVQIHCYETTDLDGLSRVRVGIFGLEASKLSSRRYQMSSNFLSRPSTMPTRHISFQMYLKRPMVCEVLGRPQRGY